MIEGICPKCGQCFVGWSLKFPRNQVCSNCGATMQIYQDGKRISKGYSSLTAEKYVISMPLKDRYKLENEERVKQVEDMREKSYKL